MRRPAAVGLALVFCIIPAGCGSTSNPQRRQLISYLNAVDAVERQLTPPLAVVSQTAAEFSQEQGAGTSPDSLLLKAHERALRTAWKTLGRLAQRISAVPAPAPALRLRSLLVRLVSRQAALARELLDLISFLPGFARALAPLGPATRTLERTLAINQSADPATVQALDTRKAAALTSFSVTAEQMIVSLRQLRPPAVSRPSYESQLAALRGMSSSARALAAALQSGDAAKIPSLLQAFDAAAAATRTLGAQRARRAAVVAYNQQVGELSGLAGQAQDERLRLGGRLT